MSKRIKARAPDGNLVDAQRLTIEASEDSFSDVLLEDGTTIRLKVVAIGAIRYENQWDLKGDPIYTVQNQVVLTVKDCPDEGLRRPQ